MLNHLILKWKKKGFHGFTHACYIPTYTYVIPTTIQVYFGHRSVYIAAVEAFKLPLCSQESVSSDSQSVFRANLRVPFVSIKDSCTRYVCYYWDNYFILFLEQKFTPKKKLVA